MITNQEHKTFEEVLQDPNLAHFHEAIRYLENTPFSEVFPKKHELGLTHFALEKTIKLFNQNPHLPLKTVVMTIFEKLTDDISDPLILKLTEKIVVKWESLSAAVLQENRIAVAA